MQGLPNLARYRLFTLIINLDFVQGFLSTSFSKGVSSPSMKFPAFFQNLILKARQRSAKAFIYRATETTNLDFNNLKQKLEEKTFHLTYIVHYRNEKERNHKCYKVAICRTLSKNVDSGLFIRRLVSSTHNEYTTHNWDENLGNISPIASAMFSSLTEASSTVVN